MDGRTDGRTSGVKGCRCSATIRQATTNTIIIEGHSAHGRISLYGSNPRTRQTHTRACALRRNCTHQRQSKFYFLFPDLEPKPNQTESANKNVRCRMFVCLINVHRLRDVIKIGAFLLRFTWISAVCEQKCGGCPCGIVCVCACACARARVFTCVRAGYKVMLNVVL